MTDDNLQSIESLEIRPVVNGYLVTTRTDDDEKEYVFDSHQKTLRFIKKLVTPIK